MCATAGLLFDSMMDAKPAVDFVQLSKTACTHKSSKSALTQLNVSLAEDLAAAGLTHVGVHNLSPGMVLTDLLLKVGALGRCQTACSEPITGHLVEA